MALEKSDKSAEVMSSEVALREASNLMRQLAGSGCPGETVKAALWRVTRRLQNWKPSRIRDVWYCDPRVSIRGEELAQLRALAEPKGSRASPDELQELRSTVARLAKYEALLQRIDADFYGPEISASRDQAGQARRLLGKGRV